MLNLSPEIISPSLTPDRSSAFPPAVANPDCIKLAASFLPGTIRFFTMSATLLTSPIAPDASPPIASLVGAKSEKGFFITPPNNLSRPGVWRRLVNWERFGTFPSDDINEDPLLRRLDPELQRMLAALNNNCLLYTSD